MNIHSLCYYSYVCWVWTNVICEILRSKPRYNIVNILISTHVCTVSYLRKTKTSEKNEPWKNELFLSMKLAKYKKNIEYLYFIQKTSAMTTILCLSHLNKHTFIWSPWSLYRYSNVHKIKIIFFQDFQLKNLFSKYGCCDGACLWV